NIYLHDALPISSVESIKNRYSSQNYQAAQDRVPQIISKCVVEQHRSGKHEQCRNHWISPCAIGSEDLGLASPEYEQRGYCKQIEKPFRKNSQGEELPKTTPEQKQSTSHCGLYQQRHRRGSKARMHFG